MPAVPAEWVDVRTPRGDVATEPEPEPEPREGVSGWQPNLDQQMSAAAAERKERWEKDHSPRAEDGAEEPGAWRERLPSRAKVRPGAGGEATVVTEQPSALRANIEARAEGEGDAMQILFEGKFKTMLHAVGAAPSATNLGERKDVRRAIEAFLEEQSLLRASNPDFHKELEKGEANGVVWTAPSAMNPPPPPAPRWAVGDPVSCPFPHGRRYDAMIAAVHDGGATYTVDWADRHSVLWADRNNPLRRVEQIEPRDGEPLPKRAPRRTAPVKGITAAEDAQRNLEAESNEERQHPMDGVENSLSEGMKFLMHAMHVKRGRLVLSQDERQAIEQLLSWDGGEIQIVDTEEAEAAAATAAGAPDIRQASDAHGVPAEPMRPDSDLDWEPVQASWDGPGARPDLRAPGPKYVQTLNRKFFGKEPEPSSAQGQGPAAVAAAGGARLPMLLSPRYMYAQQHDPRHGPQPQQGEEGWGGDEDLWKTGPANYFEKLRRVELREQGQEARQLARARAEDRVILSSCFEQNSAKLIGAKSSSKQRMTAVGRARHPSPRSSGTPLMPGQSAAAFSLVTLGASEVLVQPPTASSQGSDALPPVRNQPPNTCASGLFLFALMPVSTVWVLPRR